eukprot:COSAG04_NODE_2396_length_4211_cov_95.846060_6_plen_229_part_00
MWLWEQEEARAALPGMLRQAAKDGHVEDYDDDDGNPCQGMETILAEGIEVDGVDDQGYTALVRPRPNARLFACAVLLLLAAGGLRASHTARSTGLWPLSCFVASLTLARLRCRQYCATMYNKENAVAWCIEKGAEVDKQNNNGVTPLMAAARDGTILLLGPEHHDHVASHTGCAAVAGYTAIVVQLLEAGADFAQVDEFGRTADSVADEKGFPETAAAVKEFAAAHAK